MRDQHIKTPAPRNPSSPVCSTTTNVQDGRLAPASTTTTNGTESDFGPGYLTPFRFPSDSPFIDPIERLLFIEAIEAARCLEERVIESVADANVGSLLGIGYPRWTRGVLQYIDGYRDGPRGFVARAHQIAAAHGARFRPPASVLEIADRGTCYASLPQ
ncbi:hypothetical protein [Nocardia sp. NPDC057030]|uniref:hypothetical protein n=1 Tax=unclassified Nocardia TaxID=2637762 RepID=UPI00363E7CA4